MGLLKQGNRGDEVRTVQDKLKKLGFAIDADGIGEKTHVAIITLQTIFGYDMLGPATLLLKALARDPADRFESAAAFAEALLGAGRAHPHAWRSKWVRAGVVLLGLALIAGMYAWWHVSAPARAPSQPAVRGAPRTSSGRQRSDAHGSVPTQSLRPVIALQASAADAIADLATRGLGVAILSKSMAARYRDRLTALTIDDVETPALLALVRKTTRSPALREFLVASRQAFGPRRARKS